ncbi:MAG: hypothetical protein M3Q58_15265 [Bacteroidota bacterium]|nr:hypothetical protein [Bacteroidota bacterium]
MKKLLLILLTISFFSCSTEPLDQTKSEEAIESLLQKISMEEYDKISDYYTDSFNSGEPIETRTEKFKALRNAMGAKQSHELIEAVHEANFAEQAKLNLTYKIKYSRVTAIEKFSVVNEDGAYKVARHDIKTENL